MVLSASWGCCHECFLDQIVQVSFVQHVFKQSVLEDGGEQLTSAGCQGNWSEVGGCCCIFSHRLSVLRLQFSMLMGSLLWSTTVEEVDQGWISGIF